MTLKKEKTPNCNSKTKYTKIIHPDKPHPFMICKTVPVISTILAVQEVPSTEAFFTLHAMVVTDRQTAKLCNDACVMPCQLSSKNQQFQHPDRC